MNSAVVEALSRRHCTPTSLHIARTPPLTPCESGSVSVPTPACAPTWGDPVPLFLLFAHQYRTGCISPSDRTVRSCTVEDEIRNVAQAFSRVGSMDPRLNSFGELDHRLQALLRSWKKSDPPTRVKPLPLVVLRQAQVVVAAPSLDMCIPPAGDCLLLAYFFLLRSGEYRFLFLASFFLLRPGKYSGVPVSAADDLFRIQDVGVWIHHIRHVHVHYAEERHSWQNAGARSQRTPYSMPRRGARATPPPLTGGRRGGHHPLNAFRRTATDPWRFVRPANITALLRRAVRLLPPSLTDFSASVISARSTRAGGAMALLCGGIDSDRIRLIGRWHSDEMCRFLHVQAQPIMSGVAAAMLRGGNYRRNSPHHHPWCPTISRSSGPIARGSAPTRGALPRLARTAA
jgi:hypothetical protein